MRLKRGSNDIEDNFGHLCIAWYLVTLHESPHNRRKVPLAICRCQIGQ